MSTTLYEYGQGEYYETGGMRRHYLRSFVPVHSSGLLFIIARQLTSVVDVILVLAPGCHGL
jgi:hypothetical protein